MYIDTRICQYFWAYIFYDKWPVVRSCINHCWSSSQLPFKSICDKRLYSIKHILPKNLSELRKLSFDKGTTIRCFCMKDIQYSNFYQWKFFNPKKNFSKISSLFLKNIIKNILSKYEIKILITVIMFENNFLKNTPLNKNCI